MGETARVRGGTKVPEATRLFVFGKTFIEVARG